MIIDIVFLALAHTVPGQDVPMELPRRPKYEVEIRSKCEDNSFSIAVENDGFRSRLLRSHKNGKDVNFNSVNGTLNDFLKVSRAVSLAVSSCDGGDITIAVSGISNDATDENRGNAVNRFFGSKKN
jgi:hypothetical protein